MHINKAHIYLSLSLVSLSMGVQSNSWDVLQTVSIDSNFSLQQVNSHHSQQALNIINANTVIDHSQQQLSLMGNSVNLYQINSSQSQQALNFLSADDVKGNEQAVLNSGELTLSQTEGAANLQAANVLITYGDLFANQRLLVNSINLQQYNGQDNIQAGNIAIGNTGQLTQNFSAQQVNINRKGEGAKQTSMLQAANYVKYTGNKP